MRSTLLLLVFVGTSALSGQVSTTPAIPNVGGVDPTINVPVPTEGTVAVVPPTGETTLQLDVSFGTRLVPASRITVAAGERVTLLAPAALTRIAWRKDGHDLSGATASSLVLPSASSADAGIYVAANTDPVAIGQNSQSVILNVGPTSRLLNISTRGWVAGADKPFIGGFVVSTEGGLSAKKLILRAIGPSLAKFDVAQPLQQPTITVYDSAGRTYNNRYVYPAVVGGLTYETDLAASLAKTGAFPVPTGVDAKDVTALRPFVAGSYTVQIGSADGSAGAVLFEVYEVP